MFRADRCIVSSLVFAITVVAGSASSEAHEPEFAKRDGVRMVAYEGELESRAGLIVDLGDVDVYVREAAGRLVRVECFVSAPSEAKAREYYEENLDIRVEHDERGLRIVSGPPAKRSSFSWRAFRNVRAWAIIDVPRRIDADVRLVDGDLHVDALDGDVAVHTVDGDIALGDMRGGLYVKSVDGDITVDVFEGDAVRLYTADGDLLARGMRAETVSIESADGDVTVPEVSAGSVAIQTADGDISLGIDAKRLRVICADGDMDIELRGEVETDLQARDGDIALTIPRSIGFEVDLRGDNVSVRGGLDLRGKFTDRQIVGLLNDGGPMVRAETVDGRIALHIARKEE